MFRREDTVTEEDIDALNTLFQLFPDVKIGFKIVKWARSRASFPIHDPRPLASLLEETDVSASEMRRIGDELPAQLFPIWSVSDFYQKLPYLMAVVKHWRTHRSRLNAIGRPF